MDRTVFELKANTRSSAGPDFAGPLPKTDFSRFDFSLAAYVELCVSGITPDTGCEKGGMAKAKDKVVVELNVNSAPPVKISDDRRGFVLSKTQAALCAIDNSAVMESYARADTSSDPRDKREALVLARDWHKKNLFVQAGLGLKVGFSNYGLRLKPIDKVGKQSRQQLNAWWLKNKRAIRKFIRETWEDWHIMDNAVAFWRKQGAAVIPRIITLKPEDCLYSTRWALKNSRSAWVGARRN